MTKHILPKLPYAYSALEPHIDAKTMEIHHTKHHQTYVDKLNAALDKHPKLFEKSVEELLVSINDIPKDIKTAVQNHGGGHANHSLFWTLLTANKTDNEFKGPISDLIKKDFTTFDEFKRQFAEMAMNRFGSGWAWLVLDGKKLKIISTANQDSPLMEKQIPLLGIDVWEHGYYIKWQSNRKGYIENIWNVINWNQVNSLYEKAMK